MVFFSLIMSAMTGALVTQQQPAADEQSTIVVTGKNSEKEIDDFVRALTPVRVGGRLSRFEQSVCPVAVGLPPEQAKAVASRMSRLAREAGVYVGGADCVPNVVVMVTRDKQLLMRELRRRYSHFFGQMSAGRIRKYSRQAGPAVAWHTEGPPLSARGVELAYDETLGAHVNRTTDPASRLEEGGRRQFAGAVVVVERAALAGLTVTQLADYAAMRAFTGADPARLEPSGASTILRVLEAPMGSEVPVTLTQWDLAFLRGFYASPRNLRTSGQRSAIRRTMEQEVKRRAAE